VPGEPLLEPHAESVDVLVHCLNQSNCLDNRFVLLVHIVSTLLSRVGVSQSQLGSPQILIGGLLQKLLEVSSNTSEKLLNGVIEGGSEASSSKDSIKNI
jgi:hypothetical protein